MELGQNPCSKTLLQVLYCKDFSELKFQGPGISHESRVESMSNVVLVVRDWEIDENFLMFRGGSIK